MNIVILSGKILSDVKFDFIPNQKEEKHISIARGKILLDNNSIVNIYCYDEIADKLYQNTYEYVYLEGIIDQFMEIEIIKLVF